MQDSKTPKLMRRALWALAIVAGVSALGAIGFDIARRAGGMRPATTTVASALSAQPNARIKVVAKLENSVGLNAYSAELLESHDGSTYRVTPAHIRIALAADTSIVMGTAADLRPGAVVQASGAMDGTRTLHARQIVVLTGMVRIVPDH